MGFFSKLANKALSGTSYPSSNAQTSKDSRPPMPEALSSMLRSDYFVALRGIRDEEIPKTVSNDPFPVMLKKKKNEGRDGYQVISQSDGTVVAWTYSERIEDAHLNPKQPTLAVLVRPIWEGMQYATLYLKKTEESKAETERLEALELWISVNADKWHGPENQKCFENCQILTDGKEKPTFIISGDGIILFEVTPRMKCYGEIAARAKETPRKVTRTDKYSGDYKDYYRVCISFS